MSVDHPPSYEVLLALDGAVPADRTKRILDHLCVCSQCRASADAVETMLSMVASAPESQVGLSAPATGVQTPVDGVPFACARQLQNIDEDSEFTKGMQRPKRGIRTFWEHRPHVLSVIVNGRPVADLAIARKANHWTLEVDSPIECVEVMSDQGLCLLSLHVEASSHATEVKQTNRLSDGRDLELAVSQTTPSAMLWLSYRDVRAA